jgi:hypothetical protein
VSVAVPAMGHAKPSHSLVLALYRVGMVPVDEMGVKKNNSPVSCALLPVKRC